MDASTGDSNSSPNVSNEIGLTRCICSLSSSHSVTATTTSGHHLLGSIQPASKPTMVALNQALHVSTTFASPSPNSSAVPTRGRPAFRFPTQRKNPLPGGGFVCCANGAAEHTCTFSVDHGLASPGHSPEPDSPLSVASATNTTQSPAELYSSAPLNVSSHAPEDVNTSPNTSLDELVTRRCSGMGRTGSGQTHPMARQLESFSSNPPASSDLPPLRRQISTRNSGPGMSVQSTQNNCANCEFRFYNCQWNPSGQFDL